MANTRNYNQYTLIHTVAAFIRKNPNHPVVKQLRTAKTQQEVHEIFVREVGEVANS